jgi:hypothetical protein
MSRETAGPFPARACRFSTMKTSAIILAHVQKVCTPQTPSSIAAALPIPRERAKKAMQRLAEDGRLLRTKQGYVVPGPVGTFCCITTPL